MASTRIPAEARKGGNRHSSASAHPLRSSRGKIDRLTDEFDRGLPLSLRMDTTPLDAPRSRAPSPKMASRRPAPEDEAVQ